jgi:hypothetical protein
MLYKSGCVYKGEVLGVGGWGSRTNDCAKLDSRPSINAIFRTNPLAAMSNARVVI